MPAAGSAVEDSPFSKGDSVIYPQHGAGKIVDRVTKTVGDVERDYFVVDLELQDLRVWVPVEEAEDIGVREPTAKDELDDLFDLLADHDVRIPSNFSRRMKNNQRRMNDGDVWQLAEVVRNLAVRRSRKHLSPSEKTLFLHARGLLVAELALSMGVSSEKAEKKLDDHLPEYDPLDDV
ncbi:MAG: CarD family transcriptional regulator [Acidimicrobiales bacterium]|nr:CarD family transcriptional regulator [Acidimicrobiales bacterium]